MKRFFLFVLLQVAVLGYLVGSQYAVEWFGKEVRLQTAPVDPKDVLYGDYVTLNYEISNIDVDHFDQTPEPGDPVYVVLKKEGLYDQLVSAYLQKPSISADQTMIKGRVDYVTNRWDPVQGKELNKQSARIVYGFERYYVPEGKGKEFENKRGQFDVIIKTSPFGQHLSSLSFIANGVLSQWEIQDLIAQYYEKQQTQPIDILNMRLVSAYQNLDGPVWLVEVRTYSKKTQESPNKLIQVVVDAKSGKVLSLVPN